MQPITSTASALDQAVEELSERIRDLRRHLHRHPEPSSSEYRTTQFIAEQLEAANIPFRIASSGRGIIADSDPDAAGAAIALRADIDALRLQDEKTVFYRSAQENLMHACGHDAHTAMLLGCVLALQKQRGLLPPQATWRAIFQPSEETATGAKEMVAEGALEGVERVVALHVDPLHDVPKIGYRAGALTACCDEFDIHITGRGGHGARPHQTVDPIAAGVQLVSQVYAAIPRAMDSREPAVISFGVFQSGLNPNVIPQNAYLRGTIRTLSPESGDLVFNHLKRICRSVGDATGTTIAATMVDRLGPVINHRAFTEFCRRAAAGVVGEQNMSWIDQPSMGGEDFAYYLDHAQGCLLRLGCNTPGEPPRFLHSPTFDIDERCLPIGAKVLARCVLMAANEDE